MLKVCTLFHALSFSSHFLYLKHDALAHDQDGPVCVCVCVCACACVCVCVRACACVLNEVRSCCVAGLCIRCVHACLNC